MNVLSLSPHSLSLYVDCPRCFWLKVNRGIERPKMPTPTIMSGLDLVIKAYFDQFRGKDELPTVIAGRIPGKLSPIVPPWLSLGDPRQNVKLVGKLDELLEPKPGYVAPIDHKSRGKKAEDVHRAYQLQMDVYDLLLGSNNYRTLHKAWLVYYIPGQMDGDQFTFEVDVKEVSTDPDRARDIFASAVKVARGAEPPANSECTFCKWWDQRNALGLSAMKQPVESEEVPF